MGVVRVWRKSYEFMLKATLENAVENKFLLNL
jgi:hypothetical protein